MVNLLSMRYTRSGFLFNVKHVVAMATLWSIVGSTQKSSGLKKVEAQTMHQSSKADEIEKGIIFDAPGNNVASPELVNESLITKENLKEAPNVDEVFDQGEIISKGEASLEGKGKVRKEWKHGCDKSDIVTESSTNDNCNILRWNVRGLNSNKKQEAMINVCRIRRIGFGALLETKMRGRMAHGALIIALRCQRGTQSMDGDIIKQSIKMISRKYFYDFPQPSLTPPEETRKLHNENDPTEGEEGEDEKDVVSEPSELHPLPLQIEASIDVHTHATHDRLDYLIRQNQYIIQSQHA
uniref:Uncharacterized protein n=1 Tax=Cannabis sativa TaxID=3483 RepID=A0A803P6B1_CANSA